jgi:hypothetical protein
VDPMKMLATFAFTLMSVLFVPHASGQEAEKKPPTKESDWVTNDAAGVKVLIGYLKGKDEDTVFVGLDALARMGDKAKPAIPAIRDCLKHESWYVKFEAARTLIDLDVETELAHKTLLEAMTVKDGKVRILLASRLGTMVNPQFDLGICFYCWGPGPRQQRALRADFKEPAVKFLIAALEDKDDTVRLSAAFSLGRIGAPREQRCLRC